MSDRHMTVMALSSLKAQLDYHKREASYHMRRKNDIERTLKSLYDHDAADDMHEEHVQGDQADILAAFAVERRKPHG